MSKGLKIPSLIPLEQNRIFGVTKFVLTPDSIPQQDGFVASTTTTLLTTPLIDYKAKEQSDFDKLLEKLEAETRASKTSPFKNLLDDTDVLHSGVTTPKRNFESIQNPMLSLNGRLINNKVCVFEVFLMCFLDFK